MPFDRQSPGGITEYHKYRKKLRHLYVCTECAKGFDREKPVAKCIFCQGVVKELERDDIPSAKPLYRYTCAACDKIFIAEHANTCVSCGGRFLHFYEVTKLGTREILSMRKRQLKERIKSIKKNIKKKMDK
ncbi:MAG: hypothetical protein AABX14_00100 [Candidatus Aenigmatarchaeota archaeon]|mgnify:CR=1 FL=1